MLRLDNGNSQNLSYVSQKSQDYSSDYPAKILKSVKEQEVEFAKLTREFEADKLIAANQINRSRVDSDTASLNSIRRELGERNIDDPQMESLHYADPYSSPYGGTNRSQVSAHDPYATGDYASHSYTSRSQDYEPHSDYGSPQHSNYQEYPPSEDGQGGYGYTEPPPPNDQYSAHGSVSDAPPRESFRETDPREIEREDPYGTRDRYDGAGVEDPYRSPSPIGPDPYSSLAKTEDPYQASPGYREYAQTPPPVEEDPYVSTRQPYDEYQPDARSRGSEPEERSLAGTLDRTPSHDPFIPPEKAEFDDLEADLHVDYEPDEKGDGNWRAPDLREVIDYLGHPNQAIVAHAAGYIQHLSYQNDDVKTKTREMGGIQPLVGLLGNPVAEIHRTACGSLRNLSFGKAHEENKVKIKANGGIPALARLLRTSLDKETKDLASGTLWNLSSSEPLKKTILEDALTVIVNTVLIPESGWKPSGNSPFKPENEPWSKTFVNATGCLRNVSSAGQEARHRMRECEGLVDSLLHVLNSAIRNNDMDNKVVENTLCIIRNLTFRIANEANHPDAVPLRQTSVPGPDRQNSQQKKAGPQSGSLICFGGSKKKDAQATSTNGTAGKSGTWNPSQPIPNLKKDVKGVEQLWQPNIVNSYLFVLAECSQPASLEAAAGTIQNISAGDWQWSMYIRAEMRKEKGLPILVELLRMKNDRVMIAVAKALRNLAMDPRNKDLIGKYGMQDLVERLPASTGRRTAKDISNEAIVAVLNTMVELVTKNQENAKSLRSASGIERLVSLTKSKGAYPTSVIKAAYQVLHAMWSYKDLRPQYKKDGWDEKFFHASSTFTTLPRKQQVAEGALPPTTGDSENNAQPPARTNTITMDQTRPSEPSQPTRPAPELSYQPHDEPPPPFEDPYVSQPRVYDERSVDRDYGADTRPSGRQTNKSNRSRDRLDDRAIPGEEIAMQPMSNDYMESPYSTASRKAAPVGGVSVYGRAPEPQVDHSMYSSTLRSTSHDSSYDRHGDYADYSTAQQVQLAAQDEPAGDSWV